MNDTIRNENVRANDLSIVDECRVAIRCDGEVSSLNGWNASSVHDVGAVDWHSRSYNMVREDLGQVCHAEICQITSKPLECSIVGNEEGQIRCIIKTIGQVQLFYCTYSRGEIKSNAGRRDVLWKCEKSVNDVNSTTRERNRSIDD